MGAFRSGHGEGVPHFAEALLAPNSFHVRDPALLRPQFRQLIACTVVLRVQCERFAVVLDR
jgi:hypothetical protein